MHNVPWIEQIDFLESGEGSYWHHRRCRFLRRLCFLERDGEGLRMFPRAREQVREGKGVPCVPDSEQRTSNCGRGWDARVGPRSEIAHLSRPQLFDQTKQGYRPRNSIFQFRDHFSDIKTHHRDFCFFLRVFHMLTQVAPVSHI